MITILKLELVRLQLMPEGADTITLTSVGALATINANEGNDTIEMDEDTGAYVVLGGAGDDNYDFN